MGICFSDILLSYTGRRYQHTSIGKTVLAERLIVELEEWLSGNWTQHHREDFDDEEKTRDFALVAARGLEEWGSLVTSADHADTQRLLTRTVDHLRTNQCLLHIDSLYQGIAIHMADMSHYDGNNRKDVLIHQIWAAIAEENRKDIIERLFNGRSS